MNTFQEIFEANQILTVAKAAELKGKRIACTSDEYKANKPSVRIFTVGEIISEWDDAANRAYPDQQGKYTQYDNYQQYWASYMTERQIDEQKTRILLLSSDGNRQAVAHTKYANYYSEPVFTGSDADREVYFIEVDPHVIFIDSQYNNGNFAVVSESEFLNRFKFNPGTEVLFQGPKYDVDAWVEDYCKQNGIELRRK